jgi:hypothetical protein
MRIFTAHDPKGHIHEVVITPSDAPPATVSADNGLLVTEAEPSKEMSGLDLRDLEHNRSQFDKAVQQLRELRVQVGKTKLVSQK